MYDQLRVIESQRGPGRVVGTFSTPGRFTEGAAPGSEGSAGYSPDLARAALSLTGDRTQAKTVLQRVTAMRARGQGTTSYRGDE